MRRLAYPVRPLTSHADLYAASGQDPYVRYDVPAELAGPAWACGDAVAFVQCSQRGRRKLTAYGPLDDVDALLAALVATRALAGTGVTAVSVPPQCLHILLRHLDVSDGGDWDWMWSRQPPAATPHEGLVADLAADDLPEVVDLLARGNPTTHATPGGDRQRWVGIRDDGGLLGCACLERTVAGWPHLSGVTVDPAYRGRGWGLAMTALLTRDAVHARGVCTLGMYSDNDRARRVYQGLGYQVAHAWVTRRLLQPL